MKTFIVLVVFVAAAVAAPASFNGNYRDIANVRSSFDNIGVDGYNFGYENSDGSSRQEEATLKNVGTDQEALVVRGQYSYVGTDNVVYTVTYTADENGFHAEAAHLPQSVARL